jgi:acyl-CoA thioesterase FadM
MIINKTTGGIEFIDRITFCNTNAEGNVSHHEYARLFGVVRELWALEVFPDFKNNVGKAFLLKTSGASYEYIRDFVFGDLIRIKIRIKEWSAASFTIEASFEDHETGHIHATGQQKIVYTDIKGKPRRLPEGLTELLSYYSQKA